MSSGFISEAEIAEQRRIRQEEWERVRTADQPLEAPEEPYDSRSLYERLQEQKNKRDAEYQEAHKLKNMIKGLDDDEVEFLDLVDRTKLEEERKKKLEEEKEMRDFKAAVASLQEKSLDEKLKQELKKPQTTSKNTSSGRSSQLKLLDGVVIKRSDKQKQGDVARGVKRKLSPSVDEKNEQKSEETKPLPTGESSENNPTENKSTENKSTENKSTENKSTENKSTENKSTENNSTENNSTAKSTERNTDIQVYRRMGGMRWIASLPSFYMFCGSSDSDSSSDTDQELEPSHYKYDIFGRKIEVKEEEKSCISSTNKDRNV